MAKERMLTVLVPIKGDESWIVDLNEAPNTTNTQEDTIYRYGGVLYRRVGNTILSNVVDREFPELGNPLELFTFQYDAVRMGTAPTISASAMWPECLDSLWTQDCHVSFDGENFYLKQIPTSSKSNEDARFKHEMNFVAERVVLERTYLYDIVSPYVTEKPLSESAVFSFFGDINELRKRINASLLRSGLSTISIRDGVTSYLSLADWNKIGRGMQVSHPHSVYYQQYGGNYTAYLNGVVYEMDSNGEYIFDGYQVVIGKDKYGATYTSEEKKIEFENNFIHDALQKVKDDFELQYYFKRTENGIQIVFGDCEWEFAERDQYGEIIRNEDGTPTTPIPFAYGRDNELLSIEKSNTTENIVTRCTGLGSTENIPWYYPNPTADGWIRPLYSRDDSSAPGISYPEDEGDSVAESVIYEKYLKNRLGDEFVRGHKVSSKSVLGYVDDLTAVWTESDGNYFAEWRYVVLTKDALGNNYTNPSLQLNFNFPNDIVKFKVILKDSTDNTTETYDSTETYGTPSDFQTLCMLRGEGGNLALTPGHRYLVYFGVWISDIPTTLTYDFAGYYYAGRNAGYTTDYNQYYPNWAPIWRYVFFRADFYNRPDLVEIGKEFAVTVSNAQYQSTLGYSIDGTPATGQTPLERIYGKKYKDLNTGTIYRCFSEEESAKYHLSVFEADPDMDLKEWLSNFVYVNLAVWENDGWYKNGKLVNLDDYAITLSGGIVSVMDTISFQRVKYVTPQERLMPELYVRTDGERRFYGAKNYPVSGSADEDAGEALDGNNVVNTLYNDEDGHPYVFENEYIKRLPGEHIEVFDDIKPSIEGMTNYLLLKSEPSDWATNYSHYYKLVSGSYVSLDTAETWAADTYYVNARIDVVEEFGYDLLDDDGIWESNEDGNVEGEYKHPHFFAKLRPLGFNLFDLALTDDMVITMNTGHCGACKFKIKVDENTKKNPVQIWVGDVYERQSDDTYVQVYNEGELRRYVDTSNLFYLGEDGVYYSVNSGVSARAGFLVDPSTLTASDGGYIRNVYSAEEILNGKVGALKQDNKTHMEGDVVTSGYFIDAQQDTSENYVWVALEKDTDTYGVLMPSAKPNYNESNYDIYIRPAAIEDVKTDTSTNSDDEALADKFVITNIRMPQYYLRSAEHNLSKAIVDYMYENNYQKFNFDIKFSRIFLEQTASVLDNLNENSVLYVSYHGITAFRQYVSHYTFKMDAGTVLPEITVQLNEELSVYRTPAQQQNAESQRIIHRMTNRINDTIAAERVATEKAYVGKNNTSVVGGNVIQRDMVTSLVDLKNNADDNAERVETNRQKVSDINCFRDSFDEYAADVDLAISRIVTTMEHRIGASGSAGCKTYNDATQGTIQFWVDNDGDDVSTVCVTTPSVTWVHTIS